MEKYEQLWECFMSEQMSAMQLDQHIREDKEFESFVWQKIREYNEVHNEGTISSTTISNNTSTSGL